MLTVLQNQLWNIIQEQQQIHWKRVKGLTSSVMNSYHFPFGAAIQMDGYGCYYNSMNCACLSIYWSAYLSSDIFRCFVELEHHQFELHPLQSIINWIEIEKLSVSILFYLFFRFLFVGLNSYNFRFDNTAYYEAIESTTPWLQGIEYWPQIRNEIV